MNKDNYGMTPSMENLNTGDVTTSEVPAETSSPGDDAPSGIDAALERFGKTGELYAGEEEESAVPDGDRRRDERGRFASAKSEEVGATDDVLPVSAGDAPQDQAATQDLTPAPEGYPDEVKKGWENVPLQVRGFLAEREQRLQQAALTLQPIVDQMNAVNAALQPIEPILRQNRIAPADYIDRLVKADLWLQRNPVEAASHLLKMYGISPEQLVSGATETQAMPQLTAYEQRLAELEQHAQRIQQQEEVRVAQQAQQTLVSFASEKLDDGTPKYPYFDRVRQSMALLLERDIATDLADAYEKAVVLNKDVRALAEKEAQARKSAESQRQAESLKRAGAAKPKVTPGKVGPANAGDGLTMEKFIDTTFGR